MTSKHPKTKPDQRRRNDLDLDPGIGTSKGTTISGEDPRALDGGSTFEGDVMNETTREGGVDPNRTGRTNMTTRTARRATSPGAGTGPRSRGRPGFSTVLPRAESGEGDDP